MTDIVSVFEVHQPHGIKRSALRRIPPTEDLLDFYFDRDLDERILDRVYQKCYFPSNEILLALIDEFKKGRKKAKIAFGISGDNHHLII